MFELLDSDWLLRMGSKAAHSPQARLTVLFDILDDWLDAPRLRTALADGDLRRGEQDDDSRLLDYLVGNAAAAGLHEPQTVAEQLQLLLLGAMHAELRTPDSGAMRQARDAAAELVRAAAPARRPVRHPAAWGTALALLLMLPLLRPDDAPQTPAPAAAAQRVVLAAQASSLQLAAFDQARERQRRGICQYPQALMLPAEHRAMFLEGVIGGAFRTGSAEQAEILLQLAQKVECAYAPAAMVSS